jgi:mono/diheme cytochrome c family protein
MTACGLATVALLAGCDATGGTTTLTVGDNALPRTLAASPIEAGRYLVLVGGCNDCHTPAYARTNGAEPAESAWLKGSTEGHTGPWGTSYGKNLRLTVAGMTEDQWVDKLSTGASLPPMPWPGVRAMSDADKRAVYAYIKSLPGDAGGPAPAPLPPGVTPPAA